MTAFIWTMFCINLISVIGLMRVVVRGENNRGVHLTVLLTYLGIEIWAIKLLGVL
jgi:hypothetical protein